MPLSFGGKLDGKEVRKRAQKKETKKKERKAAKDKTQQVV